MGSTDELDNATSFECRGASFQTGIVSIESCDKHVLCLVLCLFFTQETGLVSFFGKVQFSLQV